ncbi:MAG: type I DNA topoisomerase [Clostridiales bacterium]|nr:type I DNA topoisomerase [Clostridiales bacterium]
MADNLLIVESPAKANTIKKFLGSKYKVVASMGHVRDLPKSTLGVDIENDFEPKYINMRDKTKTIKELKKEAKGMKKIILATDPDREGEAIAWHLAHILDIDLNSNCRVTFNEITKETVTKEIKNARKLNMDIIDAQQARRVLDRIVGYKISPLLWKKVQKGLSAGRVQSVATRLVVEREHEIEEFEPQEYWSLIANLLDSKSKKSFEASLIKYKDKKLEIESKEKVDKIIADLNNAKYIVKDVKLGERKRHSAPPFTTSTLQQEASRKLGFALKKTMSVAQTLYEGVKVDGKVTGLITYMRTDSVRVSEEARAIAKDIIISKYGKEYYEGTYYKSKSNSQDAHEAIRPAHIEFEPNQIKEFLSNDQFKLYNLIYNRFIASQMSSAVYDTIAIEIDANDYLFKATGSKIKFDGFMSVYIEKTDEKEEKEKMLPIVEVGQELKLKEIKPEQHFTEPPPRYTEASLVKTLEEKGIGRPSTYAPTITTILARRYIEKSEKKLFATELGKIVTNLLINNFGDIVDIEFTANMETELDNIEEGKEEWKQIIREFYKPFAIQLDKVEKELEHVELKPEESDVTCELCGRTMVYKYGRFGKFLACPGFPECRNAKPIIEKLDIPCPNCGGEILVKKSKKNKKYYICENNREDNENRCEYISFLKPKKKKEGK